MKKVLIISYFFPPRPGMGSQRPFGLAKYLSQYGWEPIVLTARLPGKAPVGIRVIETDYTDITNKIKSNIGLSAEKTMHDALGIEVAKGQSYSSWKSKIIKRCTEIILFPDNKKGWYRYAYESASHLLKTEKISAIISTSPPIVTHLIAKKLNRKFGVRWIADFRDPWSQKSVADRGCLIKYMDRFMEKRTISCADILVSVTKPFADKIKTLHKDKKIFCISNGYDDEPLLELPSNLTDKFTITHTGSLYNGRCDPSLLFEAVKDLINENKINKDLIEIRFYGTKEDWLFKEIDKYDLYGIVNSYGCVPIQDSLMKQNESQLLLLIRWDIKRETGALPAKIYEYMNANRPIIAFGGFGGIVKDILEETNAGKFVEDIESLKSILKGYYYEYLEYGKVNCKSNTNIKKYSYKIIAKKYSDVLNNLIENKI